MCLPEDVEHSTGCQTSKHCSPKPKDLDGEKIQKMMTNVLLQWIKAEVCPWHTCFQPQHLVDLTLSVYVLCKICPPRRFWDNNLKAYQSCRGWWYILSCIRGVERRCLFTWIRVCVILTKTLRSCSSGKTFVRLNAHFETVCKRRKKMCLRGNW